MAPRKRKQAFCAPVSVFALAIVLIFNFAKPAYSFHDAHFHDHDHILSKPNAFHADHPAHKHSHTHSDGTTHEHEYHDSHCAKISTQMVWSTPINFAVPPALRFFSEFKFFTQDPVLKAHLRKLLRPPILA